MARSLRRRAQLGTAVALLAACVLVAPPAALAQESQFFDSDGVQIHYVDQGEGEPVVLIHGFSGSLSSWQESGFAETLEASGFRVVSLDVRGHGKSGKPHDKASYGTHVLADVARLMDHLAISTAHLVGYSMGGGTVLGLLGRYPDRIRSAVVGGFGVVTQSYLAMRAETTAEGLAASFAESPARLARNDLAALAAIRGSYGDVFVTPETFPNIQVPLAAIIGGDDPRQPYVERLSDLHPATQVTVLPGYGHGDAPGSPEFLAAVQSFLADARAH